MLRFVLIAAIAFMVSSCTKEEAKEKLCETGKSVATVVSAHIATELACSNVDAIKADLEEKLVANKV